MELLPIDQKTSQARVNTGKPGITLVEVPVPKPKRRVFEVTPMGGIDALFLRGRFDDSHAAWCVHPVGEANNAIKHVSRASGVAIVAFLNGDDRSPNLAVLATEVLITKGHMNQDEVQAIRDALDAEVFLQDT